MVKTYNLVESVWQMNPFITLETSHDWSDLDDLASELSAGTEPDDLAELAEEQVSTSRERSHAA